MRHIKTFEKLADTPKYNIGDYVFININRKFIYYGEIIDITKLIDNDLSTYDYLIKYLNKSIDKINITWFIENSIDRFMTEDEKKLFKERIKILEDTEKYNL